MSLQALSDAKDKLHNLFRRQAKGTAFTSEVDEAIEELVTASELKLQIVGWQTRSFINDAWEAWRDRNEPHLTKHRIASRRHPDFFQERPVYAIVETDNKEHEGNTIKAARYDALMKTHATAIGFHVLQIDGANGMSQRDVLKEINKRVDSNAVRESLGPEYLSIPATTKKSEQ